MGSEHFHSESERADIINQPYASPGTKPNDCRGKFKSLFFENKFSSNQLSENIFYEKDLFSILSFSYSSLINPTASQRMAFTPQDPMYQ